MRIRLITKVMIANSWIAKSTGVARMPEAGLVANGRHVPVGSNPEVIGPGAVVCLVALSEPGEGRAPLGTRAGNYPVSTGVTKLQQLRIGPGAKRPC